MGLQDLAWTVLYVPCLLDLTAADVAMMAGDEAMWEPAQLWIQVSSESQLINYCSSQFKNIHLLW